MPVGASSFTAIKPSSTTTASCWTAVLVTSHVPSDGVGNFSLDEPGRTCRESVQLYKTNIILMWPVMTRNGVLSVAALYILNTVTVQSLQWITNNVTQYIPSWEANSFSATHSIPRLLQKMWGHYNFHHRLTHTLSANFFSPPIFCSHIYYSLNNITITAHMFSALQKPCWYTKMTGKEKWDTDKQQNHWLT